MQMHWRRKESNSRWDVWIFFLRKKVPYQKEDAMNILFLSFQGTALPFEYDDARS